MIDPKIATQFVIEPWLSVPAGFLDKGIDEKYPLKDYHSIYYGEVLAISVLPSFLREQKK